jgi:hypothetical protein
MDKELMNGFTSRINHTGVLLLTAKTRFACDERCSSTVETRSLRISPIVSLEQHILTVGLRAAPRPEKRTHVKGAHGRDKKSIGSGAT